MDTVDTVWIFMTPAFGMKCSKKHISVVVLKIKDYDEVDIFDVNYVNSDILGEFDGL